MITFTNFSDEDFVGVWAKRERVFPAFSTEPIIESADETEQRNIAKHYTKHLVDRELQKAGKLTSDQTRKELEMKALHGAVEPPKEVKKSEQVTGEIAPEGDERSDLILKLEEKGVKVDRRKSTDSLKKLLKETQEFEEE